MGTRKHKAVIVSEASAENVVHDHNEEQRSECVPLKDTGSAAELFGWAMARVDESPGVSIEVHYCRQESTRNAVIVK